MCVTLYLELRVAMDPLPLLVLTLYLELRVAMDVFDTLPRTKSGNGCAWPFN